MFTFPNAILDQATGAIITQTPAPPYAYLMFDASLTEAGQYHDFFTAFTTYKAMAPITAVAGTGGGAVAALLVAVGASATLQEKILKNEVFKPIEEGHWFPGLITSWSVANDRHDALYDLLSELMQTACGESRLTLSELAAAPNMPTLILGAGDCLVSHETHPDYLVADVVHDAVMHPAPRHADFFRVFHQRHFIPPYYDFDELGRNPAVLNVPLKDTEMFLTNHFNEALAVECYPTQSAWLDALPLDAFAMLLRAYEAQEPRPNAYLSELKRYFAWRCENGADPVTPRPLLRERHVNCPPVVMSGEWNQAIEWALLDKRKALALERLRLQDDIRGVLQRIPDLTTVQRLHDDQWFDLIEAYTGYKARIKTLVDERVEISSWLGLRESSRVTRIRYQPTPQREIQAQFEKFREMGATASPALQAILRAGYPVVSTDFSQRLIGVNMTFDYRDPHALRLLILGGALYLRYRMASELDAWKPLLVLMFGEQVTLPTDLKSFAALMQIEKPRKLLIAAAQLEVILNAFAKSEAPREALYMNVDVVLNDGLNDELIALSLRANERRFTDGLEMKHVIGRVGFFAPPPPEPPIIPRWIPGEIKKVI